MSDRLPFSLQIGLDDTQSQPQPQQPQFPLGLNDLMAAFRSQVGQPNGQPTMADAAQWHGQNLLDAWGAIKDPQTWVDAAKQYGQGMLFGSTAPGFRGPGITAFHGSPYDFDAFDASKIGTGEGAQAYGHGLYFAERPGVAESYRDNLSGGVSYQGQPLPQGFDPHSRAVLSVSSRIKNGDTPADAIASVADAYGPPYEGVSGNTDVMRQIHTAANNLDPADFTHNEGHMYEVNINADPQHFLDWDALLDDQHPAVQSKLQQTDWYPYAQDQLGNRTDNPTGQSLHRWLREDYEPDEAAGALRDAGIPGIKYLDQGSRGAGQGTRNYVVFDPSIINIARKYAVPAAVLSGTGAGLVQGNDQ